MHKTKISFGLSEAEINRAINELNTYKQWIEAKTKLLEERIAERIKEEAQSRFNGAIVDDTIDRSPSYANVSVTVNNKGTVTVVVAEGTDAIWIEFGAGVYHNGSVGTSPHPKGAELGFTIGSYGQGYGSKQTWAYYDADGKRVRTRGTQAKMPMYLATSTVINDIVQIAREVFS